MFVPELKKNRPLHWPSKMGACIDDVKRMSKRSLLSYIFAYGILLLGNIYTCIFIFSANPLNHIGSDMHRHWAQGIDALRLDPMSMTDPIMYQLYIGALAKLSLQIPALVAFYTSLLAVLGPWLWYRFFRELQPSRLVAFWGWAALSVLPSWTTIYAYFMQETLLIPMLGAALYATWRCKRKKTTSSFAVAVFLWILAGLTRGICIPLAAVCCTWLWFEHRNKLRYAGAGLAILLLILGPLVYRSYQVVGFFAPHGIGELSFIYAKSGKREIHLSYHRQGARWGYGFANPSMGLEPFKPVSDWSSQREGVVKVDIDIDKGKDDWNRAHQENPLSWDKYLWILKENMIYTFFGPSWPDTNSTRALEILNYHMRWIWAPLTLAAIALTFVRRRRISGNWMFVGVIMAWFFVQVLAPISVNEGRYRKPYEGLLIGYFVLLLGARINGGAASRSLASGMPLCRLQNRERRFIARRSRQFGGRRRATEAAG